MKRAKQFYNYFLKNSINVLFLIVMTFYLVSCTLYIQNNPNYNISFLIIIILGIYFAIYNLLNKIPPKHENKIKIVILISSILLYSIWNIVCNTKPVSDYAVLIDGAKDMINGTFNKLSFNKENYFYFYNFQVGFVSYLALIMKVFGTKIIFLKFIEILALSISNLMVYMISLKLYNRKIAILSTILYSTLLFNIAGSSIINNQHISMLFILLGIYCLIKDDRIVNKMFCGIFLAIAFILRSSSIIFIIAIICYIIWKCFNDNFEKSGLKIFTIFILIVIPFSLVRTYDYAMKSNNIVSTSAINGNLSSFKFVLGIQGTGITGSETKSARKTQIYYDLKAYDFDYNKYNEESKKYLKSRYTNHTKETIRYLNNTMINFAGGVDNQISFSKTEGMDNNIISLFQYYGYAQYVLIIILTFIGSVLSLKSQKSNFENKSDTLFKIVFIGYFIVHIFIEVQTRYRFDQYLILTLLSAPVLYELFIKLKNINILKK